MFARVYDRRARYTAFILLMLSINVIDGTVTRSIADPGRRLTVAAGASFDVVVVVSALYYWMLVRPGMRSLGSMFAIALAGVLHATYFYPNANLIRAILAGLCEAGLIGFVIVHVRRNMRRKTSGDTDPLEAITAAVASVAAVPAVANLISAEFSVVYYGLLSWRAKPHVASGARPFSIYRRVGQADLFAALPILCVLEMAPVHFVLRHWSPALAWIATIVSLYTVIWLIGLARAFRLRPALVGHDYLHLRYGLLFQLRVPQKMIARVRRAEERDKRSAVPRKSQPTVCIELVQPMDAKGAFGIRKRVHAVALTPDDKEAFEQALTELMRAE